MTSLMMTLAGARFRGLTEDELIREICDQRGCEDVERNEGQVALARWILGAEGTRFERLGSKVLSEKQAIRILTGEIEPSGEIASMIAEITEGQVALAMWRRPAEAKCEASASASSAPEPAVDRFGVDPVLVRPFEFARSTLPARHVQLGDRLDLINTSAGITIVAAGSAVTVPASALAALHDGIGLMLGKAA